MYPKSLNSYLNFTGSPLEHEALSEWQSIKPPCSTKVTFKIELTFGQILYFSPASCIEFPRETTGFFISYFQQHCLLAHHNPSILLKTNHFQTCLMRESHSSIIVTKSIDILTFYFHYLRICPPLTEQGHLRPQRLTCFSWTRVNVACEPMIHICERQRLKEAGHN